MNSDYLKQPHRCRSVQPWFLTQFLRRLLSSWRLAQYGLGLHPQWVTEGVSGWTVIQFSKDTPKGSATVTLNAATVKSKFQKNSSLSIPPKLAISGSAMLPNPISTLPLSGGIWGPGTPGRLRNVHFRDACHSRHGEGVLGRSAVFVVFAENG